MIPSLSQFRILNTLLTASRRQVGRMTAWLPWLGVALLVAAFLAPGSVTASRLVFQSPPEPSPIPPTPTPIPPAPQPTPTPIPPAPQPTPTPIPPAPQPTPTPVPPGPQPTPTPIPAVQSPTPTPIPAVQPPTPTPIPAVLSPTPVAPAVAPTTSPTTTPIVANQPVVNWVKFWDTMAVTFSYPWLCCGVILILLVPVVLLFLEIKGRRAPPMPPEQYPSGESGNQ